MIERSMPLKEKVNVAVPSRNERLSPDNVPKFSTVCHSKGL